MAHKIPAVIDHDQPIIMAGVEEFGEARRKQEVFVAISNAEIIESEDGISCAYMAMEGEQAIRLASDILRSAIDAMDFNARR